MHYANEKKYKRAQAAIEGRAKGNALALVGEGKSKKLKGEALLKFVYEGLGGAFAPRGYAEVEEKKVEVKKSMKRSELDKIAEGMGLEPSDYSNKEEIYKALKNNG